LLEKDPKFQAQKIYLHGVELFNQGKWALADAEFDSALNVYPNYYRAWSKKGICAYELQQFKNEKLYYQRCLNLQPDYGEALFALGNAYLYDDELEKAVPLYKSLLESDRNHAGALLNLGICYFELAGSAPSSAGYYQAAIEKLEHWIRVTPTESHDKAQRVIERAKTKWREASMNMPSSTNPR